MTPFAENLRRRAAALKLSNAEVARRAGLLERRYGNYITGEREPDLKGLVRIAAVLQTSIDDLLNDTGLKAPTSKASCCATG
jgi:transcriptional regulator with XRE-family HTH domain